MNTTDEALRRARAALERAITPGPDDDQHLSSEVVQALVDGQLSSVDAEVAEAHLAGCAVCAEDVADLRDVQAAIGSLATPSTASAPTSPAWWWMAGAAAAAVVVLAVWGLQRPTGVQPAPAPDMAAAQPSGNGSPEEEAESSANRGLTPLTALTADEQAVIARVLAAGRLELPTDADGLRARAGTLLGASDLATGFGPLEPVGTATVSARPRFSWRSHPRATAYTITLIDDRFSEVARGEGVRATSWSPSSDLPVGTTYVWQVTAHTPDGEVTAPAPPAPEARVQILDATTAAAVLAMQQRLADRPLERGVLLARAGVLDEARRALESAPAPGPTLASTLRD